jgi:hypothetical protein
MTTVIVPTHTTKTVDCIIQDGIKYCEKTDLTNQETGVVFIGIAVLIAYMVFLGYLTEEFDNFLILIIGIIAPLVIFGLTLII